MRLIKTYQNQSLLFASLFDKINTEFDKRLLNIEEMLECRIKEIHNSINETRRRVGEIEEVIKHKTVK